MDKAVKTLFSKYEENISSLGFSLREYILSELKDVIEMPDLHANMVAFGYGPGYKDMICTIIASKKGMKLGFYKGSELPDPAGLLTGSGKVHKYVDIKKTEDFNRPELKDLLEEAVIAYKMRISK